MSDEILECSSGSNSIKKGTVLVIEGCGDGVGKSTQYSLLVEHLRKDGYYIATQHFPAYGTYHSKPVEMYLSGTFGTKASDCSPYFVNNLYALDRAIVWHTILKSQFESGKLMLFDRYTTSSLIYQSAEISDVGAKREFIDFVCDYEYNKLGIKEPDRVIFLCVPFDVATQMRNARRVNEGILNDIHESDLAYQKKVYESSMFVADYLNWDMVFCNDSNSKLKSIDEIHKDVYSRVKKVL